MGGVVRDIDDATAFARRDINHDVHFLPRIRTLDIPFAFSYNFSGSISPLLANSCPPFFHSHATSSSSEKDCSEESRASSTSRGEWKFWRWRIGGWSGGGVEGEAECYGREG